MTVKELIDKLKIYNENLTVKIGFRQMPVLDVALIGTVENGTYEHIFEDIVILKG